MDSSGEGRPGRVGLLRNGASCLSLSPECMELPWHRLRMVDERFIHEPPVFFCSFPRYRRGYRFAAWAEPQPEVDVRVHADPCAIDHEVGGREDARTVHAATCLSGECRPVAAARLPERASRSLLRLWAEPCLPGRLPSAWRAGPRRGSRGRSLRRERGRRRRRSRDVRRMFAITGNMMTTAVR